MSRGYASRRRSELMRVVLPDITPAVETCAVYRQRWTRNDGHKSRVVDVLAIDEAMAIEMGRHRLAGKFHEIVEDWTLTQQVATARVTSLTTAILSSETKAETALRETADRARHGGTDVAERRAS